MEKNSREIKKFGYQPSYETRGYQPSIGNSNNTQNTSNSQTPRGGNVAQKD